MSQLLDDFHEEVQTAEESAARRGRLGRILAREHQRQARLVESLRHDLERARENLRLRAWGELLLAQATHVPAGQDRIEVTDYYQEEPRPLTIPLDPALTVRRNAQEYLRRYTKARRSLEPLKRRLDSENARLAYLEQLEEALARAADGDTLEILEQEMLSGRILVGAQGDRVVVRADGRAGRDRAPAQAPGREGISRGAARTAAVGGGRPAAGGEREGVVRAGDGHRVQGRIGPRKSRPASTHRVLRFSLPEGEEVVVGTGAEANDFVTFVLGRPDDVWMHARGVPGSHVLLRPPPGRAASPDALVRAASVAAYFSRLRTAAKAQVDWTFRKHVRRRPGGGPGQVFYREEHTLLVEPAPPPDRDERRPPHEAPP